MAFEEFERACKDTSRNLRRVPKDVRRELANRVRPEVADPLADRIRAAYRGPYARPLSAATKTRVAADPQIVIGGARKLTSNGATGRDLIYGDQFGGGVKVRTVNRERARSGRRRKGRVTAAERARQAASGRVIYKRRTTQQFRVARPTVFPTLRRSMDFVLDRFERIVMEVLE